MDVIRELKKYGRSLPPKAPPVPIHFSGVGEIGHAEHRRGIYINSGIKHHVRALLRDHYRSERAARELTGGRFGADAFLPIAALGSDSRDAIRAIKSMRMAFT